VVNLQGRTVAPGFRDRRVEISAVEALATVVGGRIAHGRMGLG